MNNIYEDLIEVIEKNRNDKISGKKIGIPYPFPRLEEELCGIQKGQVIGISGASGLGKSKITRNIFVYNTIRFAIKNNYPLKIIYFALEDNEKRLQTFMLSHLLSREYGSRVNSNILLSRGKEPLSEKTLNKILKQENELKKFFSYISFVKAANTPNQIDEYLENVALENGKFYKNEIGKWIYEPKDDTHILVIIDNFSNISADSKDSNDYNAVTRLSRDIIRKKYSDYCGFTFVNVLQQAFAVENQQYANSGNLIIQKLIPTMATIGDVKVIARSRLKII